MKTNIKPSSSPPMKNRVNSKLLKVTAFLAVILLANLFSLCSGLFGFPSDQNIALPSDNNQQLIVYNLIGEEVQRLLKPINESIDLEETFEDLRTGFYLVEVKTIKNSSVKSLVID